jgi:hypothetical protein
MQRAPYSSALTWLADSRWWWEVLYKHKLTSLTTSFTTALLNRSALLHKEQEVWMAWLLQRPYHCKYCTDKADSDHELPLKVHLCLNWKCGRRRYMDGMTQMWSPRKHAEAKCSSLLYSRAPPQFGGLHIAPHWPDWWTLGGGGRGRMSRKNTNSLPWQLPSQQLCKKYTEHSESIQIPWLFLLHCSLILIWIQLLFFPPIHLQTLRIMTKQKEVFRNVCVY